jgi:hypothetical protein
MALLALIPLLGYILLWQRVCNSRSVSAAIHASSAVLVALYLGAIANLLLPVTILLLAGGSLAAIYECVCRVRARSPLPLPLGIFLILATLFAVLHNGNSFYLYDEFAHWGIFLKEMLAADAVWGSDSRAMVLRYPPGAPLWQYFFLRFTGFSEGSAYFAQFCLLMMPLLVLWQGGSWRRPYWLVATLVLVAIAITNFGHGIASLYVDHLLGAWFAGTIFNFMLDLEDRTPRQLLSYFLPVASLVLIKDAGLYFALAAVGIMAALIFWRVAINGVNRNIGAGLITAGTLMLACVACAGLISTSWNANRNAAGIAKSSYSTSGIISGITNNESLFSEAEQAELVSRFVQVILHQQISKDDVFEPFGEFNYDIMHIFMDKYRLTTSSLILLFVIWQFVVLQKLVSPKDRWRWAIAAGGLVSSALIYIVILLLSYQFAFGEKAMILPSYLRYVHTGLLPLVLFFFLPLLPAFAMKGQETVVLPGGVKAERSAVIFTVFIAALYAFETPHLAPLYRAHETPEVRQQLKPSIDKVRAQVAEHSNMWVYFPVPDPTGIRRRIFLFDMSPVHTEVVTDGEYLNQDPSRLQDVLANWDYLWFPVQDFEADEMMSDLTGGDLKDHVFRVDRSDGDVKVIALDGVFN